VTGVQTCALPICEIWIVVVGVILFAAAIAAITFGVSDITSH